MNAPLRARAAPGANILPRHKSVARMVGFCLAADAPDTWQALVDVLVCRLAPRERGALALMALVALEDEDFDAVLRTACRPDEGRAAA